MTDTQKNKSSVVPFIYETSVTMSTAADGLSAVIDLANLTLVGLALSTDWTAANITFSVSFDNTTFYTMYDALGSEYSVTVSTAALGYVALDPADFAGVNYVKFRSGTTGTPVAQGDARTLFAYSRRVG